MFTIHQINDAHSRVKSGSDFPAYIQDIIKLGVVRYETFVSDNHTDYYSASEKEVSSIGGTNRLSVNSELHKDSFESRLKMHQNGKTDYQTFLKDCAESGICKWVVQMEKMTCIYYDLSGKEVLAERIPS